MGKHHISLAGTRFVYLSLAAGLAFTPAAQAEHIREVATGGYQYQYGGRFHSGYANPSLKADYMAADGLIARPMGLVATALGTGLFLLTLPVSLLSGSVEDSARTLVREPAEYTFTRCLGCFNRERRPQHLGAPSGLAGAHRDMRASP